MSAPHLLAVVSPHGFGHFAQTAPVVEALRARLPGLRVTLMSRLPETLVRQRLPGPVDVIPRAADFGMLMRSAIDVDVTATHSAYRRLHRRWPEHVARFADLLGELAPDLVLADVPYLPLAAARRAGLPAVALCSLNWADIYAAYCGHLPGAAAVEADMRAAYRAADLFVRPQPAMPMADLPNTCTVGPIATLGRRRRAHLRRVLGLDETTRILLVSPGGIPTAVDPDRWPDLPGWHCLLPRAWRPVRPGTSAIEDLGWPFADLLASADALLTKPGYGSFVEAACLGVPVLYVARGDWPEEPGLTAWLKAHDRAREIPREDFYAGRLGHHLAVLLDAPAPTPPRPAGADEAAERILALQQMRGRGSPRGGSKRRSPP